MVFFLGLFLLIIFILCGCWISGGSSRSEQLDSIQADLDTVCEELDLHPEYSLYESRDNSFTWNSKEIYLVLWNQEKKKYYDSNTIMIAALHELAHVIYRGKGHPPEFDQIEYRLQEAAHKIGIIDLNQELDPDYPHRE